MEEAGILVVIKRCSYLIEKTKSIYNLPRVIVESIRNELTLIADFVADKKLDEEGSSRLKYLISDVVEIVQDTHLIIQNNSQCCYPCSSIRRALSETRKHILQLGVEGANNAPFTSSSPHEGKEYVVGLEEDMQFLLHKLTNNEISGLCTTCIVGMAGIGKSTLARKVYNHPNIVNQYDRRIWVSISGELSNKELLMKLILQVVNNEDRSDALLEEMDNESLQWMLHQHLEGKKFLIVFDNIGKISYFNSILKALPKGVYAIEMKPLDDDQSWQLFFNLLLFHNQEFPKQLKMKGKEMLKRCDGLPLSIKEVATQFVIKRQSRAEWEELLESIDLSQTLAVLESINQRWNPQLKSCFLCLSFFRKGTPIRRDKLLQIWTAGEVTQQEKEEVDEDEGLEEEVEFALGSSTMSLRPTRSYLTNILEGYRTTLMKLIDECVIEVDISKNQRIKCIHVNASFHTLSMAKAEEEMVFEILKRGKGNPTFSQKPRYRAIYCSRDEFNLFTDHDERLISLFFRGGGYFDASESYWKRFQQLRTLDFESFGLKMLPETIGALTELRYLGLRDNYIQELPQSLGRLKNLEVLDIALNFALEVPDIICEMESLRHLYMSDIISHKPLKIYTLKNLETLTYISVNNWTYEVSSLEMMTNLHQLGIEDLDADLDMSKLFASLANLRKLDCLILRGFHFRSMPSLHGLETLDHLTELKLDGLIRKLPSFPRNISHLSLINSCLDEEPMPELGELLCLSYLKLKNAYTGQRMVIPFEKFPKPDVLCVEELWHLRKYK